MITSLYASLMALLLVWLSVRIVRLRRAKRIRFGDGGDPELQIAIRAQGNATEYIPLSLILLALSELGGAHLALIHAGGIAMLTGRALHARGLIHENHRFRVLGMQITVYTLIGLALVNFGAAVYGGLGVF